MCGRLYQMHLCRALLTSCPIPIRFLDQKKSPKFISRGRQTVDLDWRCLCRNWSAEDRSPFCRLWEPSAVIRELIQVEIGVMSELPGCTCSRPEESQDSHESKAEGYKTGCPGVKESRSPYFLASQMNLVGSMKKKYESDFGKETWRRLDLIMKWIM